MWQEILSIIITRPSLWNKSETYANIWVTTTSSLYISVYILSSLSQKFTRFHFLYFRFENVPTSLYRTSSSSIRRSSSTHLHPPTPSSTLKSRPPQSCPLPVCCTAPRRRLWRRISSKSVIFTTVAPAAAAAAASFLPRWSRQNPWSLLEEFLNIISLRQNWTKPPPTPSPKSSGELRLLFT